MEEGSFRCDANVSIRPVGQKRFGTRAEIKNLNSFKHVEKAIHYEIARQKELVLEGGQVVQETRLWDPEKNTTTSMRGKEEAHDYRYFPDPDLLPISIGNDWIDSVRKSLPELPGDRKKRYIDDFGLPEYDAEVLTSAKEVADYYEACLAVFSDPKQVSNWVMGSLMGLLNANSLTADRSPISAENLGKLLALIDKGTISGKIAKTVFDEMALSGKPPEAIVEEKGLVQMSDSAAIEAAVDAVLSRCPQEVAAYRGGKTKLVGFFVGQVMKETKGKANPQVVNEVLRRKLEAQ